MHTQAQSIQEAVSSATDSSEFRAGGTDLQERLRSGISEPDLVDLQGIPGLDQIELSDEGAQIGALVRVADIGKHESIQTSYPALALPAQTLATPQIRSMATVGGVLCQRTRCWYYRHPELGCPKKGNASVCPAREGNHHFGVCFDFGPCVHPHPSSIGCALLTYDAEIEVAGRGRISVADLYGDGSDQTCDHTLASGELITHLYLPAPNNGEVAAYHRQMSRTWAEWPLVEVVVRLLLDGDQIRKARVGIGGVANIPFRLTEVEAALEGKARTPEILERAAEQSVARANPLPGTAYKLEMVKGLVLQALETAADGGSGRVDFAV